MSQFTSSKVKTVFSFSLNHLHPKENLPIKFELNFSTRYGTNNQTDIQTDIPVIILLYKKYGDNYSNDLINKRTREHALTRAYPI